MIDSEIKGLLCLTYHLGLKISKVKQIFSSQKTFREVLPRRKVVVYHYYNYPTINNKILFLINSSRVSSVLYFRKCAEPEIIDIIEKYKDFFIKMKYITLTDEPKLVELKRQNNLISIYPIVVDAELNIKIVSTYYEINLEKKKYNFSSFHMETI